MDNGNLILFTAKQLESRGVRLQSVTELFHIGTYAAAKTQVRCNAVKNSGKGV